MNRYFIPVEITGVVELDAETLEKAEQLIKAGGDVTVAGSKLCHPFVAVVAVKRES